MKPNLKIFTNEDHSILNKIKAGQVEMRKFENILDDIHLERTELTGSDTWLDDVSYSNLVKEAIANNIAERRAAVEWNFKKAAISVWSYRVEAKRRGLLSPSGQAVAQAPPPRDEDDPEEDPEYEGEL